MNRKRILFPSLERRRFFLGRRDLEGCGCELPNFVAVGVSVAAASVDGVAWSPITIPAGTYRGIAYSSTLNFWVAAGNNGVLATSTNGLVWTAQTAIPLPDNANDNVMELVWDPLTSLFFAVGGHATSAAADAFIRYSADGITWSAATIVAGTATASRLLGFAHKPAPAEVSIASGNVQGASTQRILAGPAGAPQSVTWNTQFTGAGGSGILGRAVWNGTIFVVVNNSTSTAVRTSTDGLTWTTTPAVPNAGYVANHWDSFRSLFVIAGTATIVTSPDGSTWTQRSAVANTMRGSDSNSSRTVVVGDAGVFFHSTDDLTWTQGSLPAVATYQDVAAKV